MQNLLPEPPATLLPVDEAATPVDSAAPTDQDAEADAEVAARYPASSAAWATLAEQALAAGQVVPAYAYARTGYHRRARPGSAATGGRGSGPVPWSHCPNRGFLRCLYVLARAADAIGEADEAARCAQFLRDCDPAAADAPLRLTRPPLTRRCTAVPAGHDRRDFTTKSERAS